MPLAHDALRTRALISLLQRVLQVHHAIHHAAMIVSRCCLGNNGCCAHLLQLGCMVAALVSCLLGVLVLALLKEAAAASCLSRSLQRAASSVVLLLSLAVVLKV